MIQEKSFLQEQVLSVLKKTFILWINWMILITGKNSMQKGIEPLMGDLFPQIISRGNVLVRTGHCIISPEEKIQLALILVMQLLRGKAKQKV